MALTSAVSVEVKKSNPYLIRISCRKAETFCRKYVQGIKAEIGEHSFLSEAGSQSTRGLQIESQLDNAWHGMETRVSSFTITKSSDNSILQNDYPQHSYFSGEYASEGPGKQQGGQSLRPFLDEWPKNRDSWSSLEEDRSNPTSFSTTRLSISTPMASSDLSTPSSRSPHDN